MNVCPACFSDNGIKQHITSLGTTGTCTVCETSQVPVLDVQEFLNFFQQFLDSFKTDSAGKSLKFLILEKWRIFSSSTIAEKIFDEVLPKLSTKISSLDNLVEYTDVISENFTYWDTLKEDLKWKQRFFPNFPFLTEDLAWDKFLFQSQYELIPEIDLFRARVHKESGKSAMNSLEMGTPEKEQVKGGRANPMGIPYLYLSDQVETVLYEVRAAYLDELSVATFQLKPELKSIQIVDFVEQPPLFQAEGDVKEYITGQLLRERISGDLSKPIRRYDSEIEYIPTQFICEFIKIIGASGIRFKSSLDPTGNNLVIFDQSVMECKKVNLVQVKEVSLRSVGF